LTVSGNQGQQHAVVAAGGSYAGLSGNSDKTLETTATLLAGANSGDDTTVAMSWRNRNPNETAPNGTSPPLPASESGLISDVLTLTGADGDTFVLQMGYDPSQLGGNETQLAAGGLIYLASRGSVDEGMWLNAIVFNHGDNIGAANVQGAWSGQLALGTWGVDTESNVVWAVLDHNSVFGAIAAVPEPASYVLAGIGLAGLAWASRRRAAARR
jgi:hypothetical protein